METLASAYPLQNTPTDLSIREILTFSESKRDDYIHSLLNGLTDEIDCDSMSLKINATEAAIIKDFTKLANIPSERYLFTDDKTYERNVIGKGAPGGKHALFQRRNMWKMVTRQGDLSIQIKKHDPAVVNRLRKLFDPNSGKDQFRRLDQSAIVCVLRHLEMNWSVGTAFPPFAAKILAETYLPKEGTFLQVLDSCSGWGGRLAGTLAANHKSAICYVGIDPERRNREGYERIAELIRKTHQSAECGSRSMEIYSRPFEDWVATEDAKSQQDHFDFAITSCPYFNAESYNVENDQQSAVRYQRYDEWKDKFLEPLICGNYNMLKMGRYFVLNIASVSDTAPTLEEDALKIARAAGFTLETTYKLAMSINPGNRTRASSSNEKYVTVRGVKWKYEPCYVLKKAGGLFQFLN